MEQHLKNETTPIKGKMVLSPGKVLVIVLGDYRGVVYTDFLLSQRTVDAAYYCKLLEKEKTTYRSKRCYVPIHSVSFTQ